MREATFHRHLLSRVRKGNAEIAVLGLGVVGLKVALTFSSAGFKCIGADIDAELVRAVNKGNAAGHGPSVLKLLKKCLKNGTFSAATKVALAENRPDFVILCLPTPITEEGEPDLHFLTETCTKLSKQNLKNKCIILESSVYPGVTRQTLKPLLDSGGYVAGVDFGLAHSPERVDSNNSKYPLDRIPKLVGGINEASTDVAVVLYEAVLRAPVIRVDSAEVAEAAKMLENTYRFVNISLVNELAEAFEALGIDTFAVVKAASTKPFGYMPHLPGPGVGGHCIPKDPFYMMKAARDVNIRLGIVEAAAQLNQQMPRIIAARIEDALTGVGKALRGSRICILGLAYKRNVSDTRRSPAIPIISELTSKGVLVKVYDPLVSRAHITIPAAELANSLHDAVRGADVILLATDHDAFHKINLRRIRTYLASKPILFDARNFWDASKAKGSGYSYLGVGKPLNRVPKMYPPPRKGQALWIGSKRGTG